MLFVQKTVSGIISMNGAAAHKARPGEKVIICSYGMIEDSEMGHYKPVMIYLDSENNIVRVQDHVPNTSCLRFWDIFLIETMLDDVLSPPSACATVADTVLIRRYKGLSDYLAIFGAMLNFTKQRDGNTQDEVWCLQHPLTYTLGLNGKDEHILDPG